MKKSIFLAVAAVAMTACSNDVDLGMKDANKQTADNAIGFQVRNSNMSRASQELQKTGHYNFGVFAYKDVTSGEPTIMEDYLVGYHGVTPNVGYVMDQTTQTTLDKSSWAYEKLGSSEYTHTAEDGFYKKTDTRYMSNWANQFLRYWDFSTRYTHFYAYAPYINKEYNNLSTGVTFEYSTNTKVMKFPDGSIKDGYNDASLYEYLYAATKVNVGDYGKDVALTFKHINSKIMITFWEDIAGYSVKMIDLVSGTGVSAAPAKFESNEYTYGTLAKSAGAVLEFTGADFISTSSLAATIFTTHQKYDGVDEPTTPDQNEYLQFERPTATSLATTRDDAVATPFESNNNFSKTVYYAIPKDNASGLTFHCSFILTNEQTGETITVKNARVHVPTANCVWEAGKRYIYVFKITKDATGTTGNPEPIIPGDPSTGTQALHPIVFDGIQVEDWTDATQGDHNIN